MAAFVSGEFSVTGTATKIVDSADFDRAVVLSSNSSAVEVGYTSSTTAPLFYGSAGNNRTFVVPAGYELWAVSSSGTQTLGVLVTVK